MSIELIRGRQQALAAAKAAAEKREKERQQAGIDAFAATGIQEIWEQLKDLKVPDWRGNGSRENTEDLPLVALSEHVKYSEPTGLFLTDWDGDIKIAWYVNVTDKGAVRFVVGGRERLVGEFHKPEPLREHFLDYMAKFLPPLEDTNA